MCCSQNRIITSKRSQYIPFRTKPFRTDIIVTSILHDCIEDTLLTKEMIVKEFGYKIANQVEDLTRVKNDKKISSAEIVKILYQQKKKELLLIKLFGRLHNIQTVGAKIPEKGWKTILETLQSFLTIATYLKVPRVARQLYTHCLNIAANYKKLNVLRVLQDKIFISE
ncbi:Guanosine polyphosphate pyrophosphohydrolases/synthetases homolog [Rickettsia felis URRWXCal2]|uniref:Guanosine polyphosphate pyrophosphohydrolases/synthetases homolog n=1 Tax=Rickettsia felis (strain ATCC VR-1525 / URRWXCal2) TaxID=315456 RepID=Q4UMH7_RICFE|nr:Guanosine polyphosphate pyrophosphohydrolases/synthetases homolog [Rickettsia felis URRWXCal2]KHO03871.1 (p)ppGpp synthetase [Rickettsia felis]